MERDRRVTLKDIARQMDVSVGTVDRAIHDRGRVSAETRQMVLEKLRELGYTPNTLARALGRGRPTRIAFVTPVGNGFWQALVSGAQEAAAGLKDYNLDLSFFTAGSEEDVLGEAALMERAAAEQPDGILVVPLSDCLMQLPIDSAAERGIRVATVNRDSPGSKRLFYCGEDPYGVGRAIGAMHAKLLRPGLAAACMKLDAGNPNFELRAAGWQEALARLAPWARVAGPVEYAEQGRAAYEAARSLISRNADLGAIFANTSAGTEAAAEAVRDAGRGGHVQVVGLDVNERILDLLDSRAMFATIEQSPFQQGYEAVRLMHRVLMEGLEPDRSRYYTRMEIYIDRAQYAASTQAI